MSLQTELQEVLGADEEAGPVDGDESASLGGSEEKGQENIEPPVQTALLTASVPVAQVGSRGILCACNTPTHPSITLPQHGLYRKAAVTFQGPPPAVPQAVTEHKKLFGGWLASKASLFSQTTPLSHP